MAESRTVTEPLHLRGMLLPDESVRDVFVVDGRLTFTEAPDARTVLDGGYLTPGLVDAHAHLSLFSPAGDDAPPEQRVRASARAQLAAGVLAVREPGSPDYASQGVGPAEGLPRVWTAGHLLVRTGRYFPGLGREVEPDQLPEAAAQEAVASGSWVKVVADFFDPGGRITPAFPAEAITEAAVRAHAAGARITAHATCPESIQQCLDAGFDSIEHATMLQLDQLDQVVAQGTVLVPTLLIKDGILHAVTGFGGDDSAVAEMRRILDGQPSVVAAAAERGVTVLAGTDAGMVPHGLVAQEITLLLQAGLTPALALGAGSWLARQYLGLPGLVEGAPADVVGYADDPRADPGVLSRPAFVMLDGSRIATT
jgi:imidazolonepropionase-like amidohydrolase